MIAIVDDDKGAREGLARLVRSLGHNTSTFGSAEEFLEFKKLLRTSCLITDVQMPGLSGLDLHEHLIAEGHCIPVIVITGSPDDAARARAMQAGAVCFLSKPIEGDHLLNCLETALPEDCAVSEPRGNDA